jgi:hypothetical protein
MNLISNAHVGAAAWAIRLSEARRYRSHWLDFGWRSASSAAIEYPLFNRALAPAAGTSAPRFGC